MKFTCQLAENSVESFTRSYRPSPSRSDENVKKHVGSSVTKEGMVLTTCVTCEAYHAVHPSALVWYLTWGRLLPNVCPLCWIETKHKADILCASTYKIMPKRQKLTFLCYNTSWDENPVKGTKTWGFFRNKFDGRRCWTASGNRSSKKCLQYLAVRGDGLGLVYKLRKA